MSSDKNQTASASQQYICETPARSPHGFGRTWKKRRRRTTDVGHTTIFIEYYRRSMKIISLWYYIILHHITITVLHFARPCYACYTSGSLRCAPCHGKEISWQLQRDAGRVQTAGAPGSTSIGHDSGRANWQIGLENILEHFGSLIDRILTGYAWMRESAPGPSWISSQPNDQQTGFGSEISFNSIFSIALAWPASGVAFTVDLT